MNPGDKVIVTQPMQVESKGKYTVTVAIENYEEVFFHGDLTPVESGPIELWGIYDADGELYDCFDDEPRARLLARETGYEVRKLIAYVVAEPKGEPK